MRSLPTLRAVGTGLMVLAASMAVAGDWPHGRPGRDGKSTEPACLRTGRKLPQASLDDQRDGEGDATGHFQRGTLRHG